MTGTKLVALASAAALVGAAAGAPAPAGGAQSATTVKVTLKEWKLVPSAGTVPSRKVTFVARNTGNIPHELVVLRTDRHHHALPLRGAQAVESGLQGELAEIAPGQTRRLTLTLRPGKYVLICNLPGHYRAGQYANLRVS